MVGALWVHLSFEEASRVKFAVFKHIAHRNLQCGDAGLVRLYA